MGSDILKLRGSKTEQDFRNELIRLQTQLYNNKLLSKFLKVLQQRFPSMKSAFIIEWIPEQGEDIITFLVDTSTIAQIELERDELNAQPILSTNQVDEIKKNLRKWAQIKLAVAIDLAEQELKKIN